MVDVSNRRRHIDYAVDAERYKRSANAFSFSRALKFAQGDSSRMDGYEREVMDELKKASGAQLEGNRIPVPLELLVDPYIRPDSLSRIYGARKMTTDVPHYGGNIVGSSQLPLVDMLSPWSITAGAGITAVQASAISVGGGDVEIPFISGPTATDWQTGELDYVTMYTQPSVGKVVLSAKTTGVFTKVSGTLARQSSILDGVLQREFLKRTGYLIDRAILWGSGTNGQPRGIENTPGHAALSGPFNGESALEMEYVAAEQGVAVESKIGFVSTPGVRKLLKKRSLDAGGYIEPLWKSSPDGDSMAGRNAWATYYASPNTVVAGPWNDCFLAMWGVPVVEVNPYGYNEFISNQIIARLMIDCDVGFMTPSAWSVHTSVS